ncbi:MAG: SpoVR family protein, partial [Planctomycetes bacterium]|nr:SpoVR family protein [Planctomycetota bacterium]
LVINNDPCYAYLMRANSTTDQKLVMAHVYGHCDFFKNNYWFSKTNRKMMDVMANHGTRIRAYMDRHGVGVVEDFIDRVHALDNLIDPHSPFIERRAQPNAQADETYEEPRIRAKDYMDRYINPPEVLAAERKKREEAAVQARRFPPEPTRDVLLFLQQFAPLERWQQDVIAMLRDESYYFVPQMMTKIMNEGWAVYWHSKLMCEHLVEPSEIVTYCDHHSGTLATQPGRVNPYKLGVELFRDIEDRWNRGKFGLAWQNLDIDERRSFDAGLGLGREKIFEVRRDHNDVTFIDNFLCEEFAEAQNLYVYGFNQRTGQYEILDRDWTKVKQQLLWSLTNFGQPRISIVDANYRNRGELYLFHDWNGVDLQFEQAKLTMRSLFELWSRPVHVETREEGEGRLMSYDGTDFEVQEMTNSADAAPVVGYAPRA